MLSFSLCPICSETLWNYGCVAALTFENICISILEERGPFDIPDFEVVQYLIEDSQHIYKVIKFLESKGYVITTESDQNYIRIKPLGLSCVGTLCRFCLKEDEHD